MADDTTSQGTAGAAVTIPDDVRAKFPEIIELIMHSESMVDSERQYWINILPIMNEEQLKSLHDILENEKTQLAAIDAKYAAAGTQEVPPAKAIEQIAAERGERAAVRQTEEGAARSAEEEKAEALLSQIDQGTV